MSGPQHFVAANDPWPQSRHWAAVALAWALLVIYGSLTPFAFEPLEGRRAADILLSILASPARITSRGDWITNVLLLMPLGFAALGALLVDRDSALRRGLSIALVLSGGLVLSAGVEAAQLWFPPRHPSKADVIAQTIGNVLGMGLWYCAGQWLTDKARRHWHGPRAGRVVWVLAIYAAGLVIYSLLPLDLTIRPHDLWEKYQNGQIALVPFRDWRWNIAALYGAVSDAALFVPVGMLAAVWPQRHGSKERRLGWRWLVGVALVGVIEFLQVFVRSRHSDVSDLILGMIGVSAGLWLATAWSRAARAASGPRSALRGACLAGFVLFLAALYLEPFDLIGDQEEAWRRLAAMVRVPLEALRQGELLGMVSNVLRKLLLFGILGWLAANQAARGGTRNTGGRLTILWGAVSGLTVAAAIEVAQAWFPPHLPDVTDVLWGALGGGLGASLGKFLASEA